MFRVKHAIVSFFALSGIAVFASACDDETTAKPQVIFTGTTLESAGNDCRDGGKTAFKIGSFGDSDRDTNSVAVSTGSASGQGTADVACAVTTAGPDTFNVSATVVVSGATGGLFKVTGVFKTSGDQTAEVQFSSRLSANSYAAKDCVVKFTEQNMGVAAGRVWGLVSCAHADSTNVSGEARACLVEANFRFENCSQ